MRRLLPLTLLLAAAALPACVESLTSTGAVVRLGKADRPNGCREIGIVYGTGSAGMFVSSEDRLRSAQNDLRNNAAARGANYVAMDIGSEDGRTMAISGRAFYCDESEASQYAPLHKAAPPAPSSSASTVEERLARLKDLLDRGIITQAEYDRQCAEILKSL